MDWVGYEANSVGYGVDRRIFGGGAIAQVPSDDKESIPRRLIQLTAEQDHVIKEIVLKDMHIEQVPRSSEIRIGEKVPPNIELQTFPSWPRRYRKSEHTNSLSREPDPWSYRRRT